uniref:Uncharacterized protein n=1 Tax=Leersia perrieri TaxID=77586 RepID=A0A0D9VFS9_9ORYZ
MKAKTKHVELGAEYVDIELKD